MLICISIYVYLRAIHSWQANSGQKLYVIILIIDSLRSNAQTYLILKYFVDLNVICILYREHGLVHELSDQMSGSNNSQLKNFIFINLNILLNYNVYRLCHCALKWMGWDIIQNIELWNMYNHSWIYCAYKNVYI